MNGTSREERKDCDPKTELWTIPSDGRKWVRENKSSYFMQGGLRGRNAETPVVRWIVVNMPGLVVQ